MLILLKILSWIKNYWYIPIILIGIMTFFILTGGQRPTALLKVFEDSRNKHKKELEIIAKSQEEERLKKIAASELYAFTLEEIEKQYQKAQKELDEKQRKNIEKLIKENLNDPESLTKKIAELSGFDIVL